LVVSKCCACHVETRFFHRGGRSSIASFPTTPENRNSGLKPSNRPNYRRRNGFEFLQ